MSHSIAVSRPTLSIRASSSSQQGPHRSRPLTVRSIVARSLDVHRTCFVGTEVPEPVIAPTWPPEDKASGLLQFAKYHGMGKDFILVDNRDSVVPRITPDQAVKLCDRKHGIGAHAVVVAMPSRNATDHTMKVFNSDGSEPAQICGDAVLSFVQFIADCEIIKPSQSFNVHTPAGLVVAQLRGDEKIRIDMGEPTLSGSAVPTNCYVTCVSMRDLHSVTFGTDPIRDLQVDDLDLERIGPVLEHMFPARTNTAFAQVVSPNHLKMCVWEHGTGGRHANGSAACAAVFAAVREDRAGRICKVDLRGGRLEIEWSEADNHVYMTGVAERTFIGVR